jgi:hypothetical protein
METPPGQDLAWFRLLRIFPGLSMAAIGNADLALFVQLLWV